MAEEIHGAVKQPSKESNKTQETAATEDSGMHVKVYAPFKVYFDGKARSISAENETGPFDVLPKHHSFITLLSPCEIVIRTSSGEEKVKISRGIMHVKADHVVVFLDV